MKKFIIILTLAFGMITVAGSVNSKASYETFEPWESRTFKYEIISKSPKWKNAWQDAINDFNKTNGTVKLVHEKNFKRAKKNKDYVLTFGSISSKEIAKKFEFADGLSSKPQAVYPTTHGDSYFNRTYINKNKVSNDNIHGLALFSILYQVGIENNTDKKSPMSYYNNNSLAQSDKKIIAKLYKNVPKKIFK